MRTSAVPMLAAAFLTLALVPAQVAGGGGLTSNVVFVPWKILDQGESPPAGMLVLYWIPASRNEFRHSELLTYRPLTTYSPQCVAMSVVRVDDQKTIARLDAGGKLPIAVLTGEDGSVLGSVENEKGALHAAAVDKLLRDTITAREASLDRDLDDAPKKLDAGNRDAAVALYRRVWEQRCLFPRHAREAERALKKLGVPPVAVAAQ
ncbi:MAG: hypothetical protein AABO58_17045 [Acidobacteriota bacterium]